MESSGDEFPQDGRRYRITPIQQPTVGCAYRFQTLSRIPLAPPLIVQLDTWDADNNLIIPYDALPFLLCVASLQTPDGDDASAVTGIEGRAGVHTMLRGMLTTTPREMVDRAGAPGIYFVFTDIAVRFPGHFRLKISLVALNGGRQLDFCVTDAFQVVERNVYNAPSTTELTSHFAAQGVVPDLGQLTLQEYWPGG